jgi:hypothetical protein
VPTRIEEGFIASTNEDRNIQLMRPADLSHKDFMLMQKHEWKEFHRIILGLWKYDYRKQKEIEWWCNENVKGRWFHSERCEVYYFEDRNTAIHFKLRWFSEIVSSSKEN